MTDLNFTTGVDLKQARPENQKEYFEFVRRAVSVHGTKYDYEYMAMRLHRWNVKIIHKCCGAESSWVRPRYVLEGDIQCPNCEYKPRKGKAYTQEQWIEKAREVHKGYYSYEKVEYKNSTSEVIITCPEHGDFKLRATYHVNQNGRCSKCHPRVGNRKPVPHSKFIDKCIRVHGLRFDYSKTKYERSTKHVTIICREHGEFSQTPYRHLSSLHGCPVCSKEAISKANNIGLNGFLERAKNKHKSKYNYSKVNYIDSATEVEIICPEHGSFFRTPNSHMHGGAGCNKCAGVPTYDTEYFIERAKEAHKDRGIDYDYSKVKYNNSHDHVEIICKEHGSFWQTPNQHLRPSGCPECGNILGGGWGRSDFIAKCQANNNGNATLYVVKCSKGTESFYKVGVTSHEVKWRFKSKRNMPYNYKTVFEIEADGGYIYDLEVTLHSLLKDDRHNPLVDFRGKTECFSTIKPIEPLLKELTTTTEQMQLIT